MNFRRFRAGDEGNEVSVNLTPLIDVVFLLLIFFMVSTTFTRETHLAIDLPRSSGAVLEQQPRQIEIIISEAGEFSVDGADSLENRMMAMGPVASVADMSGALSPLTP